ncbi:MAG: response regulator [Acidobacteriota bacterium]
MHAPLRVLVCDDQFDVREALRLLLKGAGCHAVTVDSSRALLDVVSHNDFDVILADLNYSRDTTSGGEGLDLLAALEARGNVTPVIVMTAWASIELAVEAMRRGACDFLQKPWNNARALATFANMRKRVSGVNPNWRSRPPSSIVCSRPPDPR